MSDIYMQDMPQTDGTGEDTDNNGDMGGTETGAPAGDEEQV